MKFKCVIFDCDGVLVDSEPIAHEVMVDLANKYGANLSYEDAHQRFSGGFLKQAIDYIDSLIEGGLPSSFEREYRAETYRRFRSDIKAVEGVEEFIKRVKTPICVASNGPRSKMEVTLGVTGLIQYFKGNIFSAYDLQTWKPDPNLFLHAAKTMGYTPQECLIIEDSLSGVKAAISGGFEVYALGDSKNSLSLEDAGAKVFTSFKTLRQFYLGI